MSPAAFLPRRPPTGDPIELGVGTRYPETSGFKGCEPRHLRRRALQLQPVGQILELAACVLLVMGKAMAGKGRWRHWVSAVMTTMWALSTS